MQKLSKSTLPGVRIEALHSSESNLCISSCPSPRETALKRPFSCRNELAQKPPGPFAKRKDREIQSGPDFDCLCRYRRHQWPATLAWKLCRVYHLHSSDLDVVKQTRRRPFAKQVGRFVAKIRLLGGSKRSLRHGLPDTKRDGVGKQLALDGMTSEDLRSSLRMVGTNAMLWRSR